ncbi:MAG: chromosome segregation protein SMC [Candidatus Thermoplasmatota archaeon]
MHLREVHMENFKSFKGKLSVPFEPGYTAITGPNGSGKSNIGDAIMFVLGPNSPRAMRAKNLGELIFNGGKDGTSKPSEMCTVSLVFDNADRSMPVEADQVTLTRRIKRAPSTESPDGVTSSFYINGRGSQKKEFVDLLAHARISADGYNITLQGDVRNICLMTPTKRREILDTIAGVTAFDTDISAADRRKADVVANLERISIVLEELKRSLDQLDKEKGAAVRYRDLQATIKQAKGAVAWRRRSNALSLIAQQRSSLEKFQKDRDGYAKQVADLGEKLKEAQAQFALAEQKIRAEGGEEAAKLQERLNAAIGAAHKLEERLNFVRAQTQEAAEAAAPAAAELKRIEKELAGNLKLRDASAGEQGAAQAALTKAKQELEAMRDALSKGDKSASAIHKELTQLKVEHEAKQTELHEAQLEADRLGEKLTALGKLVADGEAAAQALQVDRDEATAALKEMTSAAGGSDKKRAETQKRLFELKKQQAEAAKQADDLNQRILRIQRELAELRASEEASARAQGNMTGAVKDILEARAKREIKGIVGTVAELVKVDKKFQEAVRIAAGGRLTAVIVEDDAAAAACIDLVKRNRSGRATLLPLNKMVPGRPSGQALMAQKKEGSLGFVMDLVEFNPRYQNAFWHVFQDTLVADSMASGRRLMGGVRVVTLDGELFEKSGAMTGGKDAKKDEVQFTNADRGRVDELLNELSKVELAHQGALDLAAKAGQELFDLSTQAAASGAQEASFEDRHKELERRLAGLAERAKTAAAELARATKEQRQVEAAREKLTAQIHLTTSRLDEMDKLRVEKGRLLLKGSGKEARERMEALEAQVLEWTSKALGSENRRDVSAKQIELVEARRNEVAAKVTELAKTQERLAKEAKLHAEAHAKAAAEVEALIKMQKKATGALKGVQEARDAAYKATVDVQSRITTAQGKMDATFALIANSNAKLPALEEEAGEAAVELAENPFEPKDETTVGPLDELRRELRNLEAQLERLGSVNMRALEEYETQATRQGELKSEVERLKAQQTDLEKLVAEISTRKKEAFMAVFTRISANVAEVYAQISMGGQAFLKLDDPNDPFAGGLTLMAQPPGKPRFRIELLSGGEQSLASMALIFAIQRDDPSPFYYFDEVDQNLDAVNSEILSRMIKAQSQFAQFIVVSLRKVTLKEASHIYGVTQGKPGESQIIARFDVDTLPDEEKGGAAVGEDGEDDDADGAAGPAATVQARKSRKGPASKPKPAQKSKEMTLSEITGAISREVKA